MCIVGYVTAYNLHKIYTTQSNLRVFYVYTYMYDLSCVTHGCSITL